MRTGSLFAGYGGLDMAVNTFFGSTTAWHSEINADASRILAHHWTDTPNLGDITRIDWSTVEPVDVLTGGFPCQDVSVAGRRAGIAEGTRSGLWSYFHEAIDALNPRWVVIENVRGLLSARADRPVESDTRTVGDAGGEPVLRALGAVLGDLSDIGYDAQWTTVAAASVGACHRRERVFILATPADAERGGCGGDARASRRGPGRRATATGGCEGGNRGDAVSLLPTPRTSDTNGAGSHGDGGPDLRTAVIDWGQYDAAVRRAELALGRSAPAPTEPNRNGNPRLSARFVEWMMMLPDGWVTDPAIGLSRNAQLKALGNGVVPPQAFAALTALTTTFGDLP